MEMQIQEPITATICQELKEQWSLSPLFTPLVELYVPSNFFPSESFQAKPFRVADAYRIAQLIKNIDKFEYEIIMHYVIF